MGNPQAKVSDIEYGWLAGFFDGEGSVVLTIRPSAAKNGGPKVQPQALLAGTDQSALDAITSILDRAEIGYHVAWGTPKGTARNGNAYKRAWVLRMVGLQRTRRFIEWILPALHTKRERGELVLRYIAARLAHSDFRTPIQPEEWAMAMQLKSLNSKTQPFTREIVLNPERPGASSEQLAANGRKGADARWGRSDTSLNDRTLRLPA
jgi:hypothetical protein